MGAIADNGGEAAVCGPYSSMHGLIVNQLREFVIARRDRETWSRAVAESGAELPRVPRLTGSYADSDVFGIVGALVASREFGSVPELLADFGEFLAGTLVRVYSPLVRPEWRTLDLIENVEEHVHTVARMRDSDAGPPQLSAVRRSPSVVEVTYRSPRRMCSLAEGIVRGLAAHYRETVRVSQPLCMHRGDDHCVVQVEQLQATT